MSKVSLYCIYDRVAEESGPVFEAKNDGVAMRKFQMFMEDKPFAEDYQLNCIGEYDHETGCVEGSLIPREVVPAVSHVDDLVVEDEV